MLLGFNGATTMKADLLTDIKTAGLANYDYLDIWTAKLAQFLRQNSVSRLREILTESGLEPLSINGLEPITFQSEEKFAEIQQRCETLCAHAQNIGCPLLVVAPGPLPSRSVTQEEIKWESREKLLSLLSIAKRYGIRLAFEFLGFVDFSVNNLSLCNEIVQDIDDPSLGLVLDTFHFFVGGSSLDSIDQIDPQKLFLVHLNDVEDLPKQRLRDEHRLLPGEGIIPLHDILKRLKRIGYQGVYSIELFRPEYWDWEPSRLATEAKNKMTSILKEVERDAS